MPSRRRALLAACPTLAWIAACPDLAQPTVAPPHPSWPLFPGLQVLLGGTAVWQRRDTTYAGNVSTEFKLPKCVFFIFGVLALCVSAVVCVFGAGDYVFVWVHVWVGSCGLSYHACRLFGCERGLRACAACSHPGIVPAAHTYHSAPRRPVPCPAPPVSVACMPPAFRATPSTPTSHPHSPHNHHRTSTSSHPHHTPAPLVSGAAAAAASRTRPWRSTGSTPTRGRVT